MTPSHPLRETPSQTAGPYVHIGLAPGAAGLDARARELGRDIAGPDAADERIRIEGLVIDGTGTPVRDAVLEAWQADARGRYAHPEGGGPVERGFRGWGRTLTDFETGEWAFDTVKPGPVPMRPGAEAVRPAGAEERRDAHGRGHQGLRAQAPHITLWIVARGINLGLATRLYFDDEAEANAGDPVLGLVEAESRRRTLIAARSMRDGRAVYRFDIRLQGEGETVFFDI
jgi:protocatechuate 3,4-dioxygenase alpha subunit